MKTIYAITTPTLALPLRGREFIRRPAHKIITFPLRGKVGMGVVFVVGLIRVYLRLSAVPRVLYA
jgi:hypothetical protein